jgi:thiamine biosynthesis protein ThiC
MADLTEREKELLGYIDKLLKFHSLLITIYTEIINLYAETNFILGFATENIKKIDPFNTTKVMIETLNKNFGTSYSVSNLKEELEKEVKKEEKIQ